MAPARRVQQAALGALRDPARGLERRPTSSAESTIAAVRVLTSDNNLFNL